MAIYEIKPDSLVELERTTFARAQLQERGDLQRLLRDRIEVIAPDTLVIAEEFGEWEDSRRRIDLLGVDKNANLVVIELKRTEDGGHMELQAIRYAAMVSTMTFSRAVDIYARFLVSTGRDEDAETALLEFLEWDEVTEEEFAQEVKIVLASAEFSRELTTSVMWLNNYGLDIRCIRLIPYQDKEKVLLDVQQIIPLPEAEAYQVSFREKTQKEKQSRYHNRDFTKYDVVLNGGILERLPKNQAIFSVVKHLCDSGVDPEEIWKAIPWKKNSLFKWFEGKLDSGSFDKALADRLVSEGKKPQTWRYFIADNELIHANGRTYAFHRMWGSRTAEALAKLADRYGDRGISFRESDA